MGAEWKTGMERILIVEDDASNNQMLKEYLESHGYLCAQAYSGSEGKLLFSMEEYDLVLLDLMLPGIPGEELVSLFAQRTPVIVLSAKSGTGSKVEVLSSGAEDYLCKPFDLPELLVRIQVQLRRRNRAPGGGFTSGGPGKAVFGGSQDKEYFRPGEPSMGPDISVGPQASTGPQAPTGPQASTGPQAPARPQAPVGPQAPAGPQAPEGAEGAFPVGRTYTYRDWTLTPDNQEMTACGEPVELTRHEFLILELLIRNPRRVFTKQMIYEYAWGEEYLAEDKTINVHISNIRSKLRKSGTDGYIQTVWGMGFKLS